MKVFLLCVAAYLVAGFIVATGVGCAAAFIEARKRKGRWSGEEIDMEFVWNGGGFPMIVALWPVLVVCIVLYLVYRLVLGYSKWLVLRFGEWWERKMEEEP